MFVGGIGGAILVSAVTIDLFVLGPNLQDFREASANNDLERFDTLKPTVEAQQSLVKGLVFSGAVITATGTILLAMDLLKDDGLDSENVSFWVAPGGGGLSLMTTF